MVERGGTAEELDSVILATMRLDVAELRLIAAARHGEAVQLIARRELESRKLDPDVLHRPAIVGVVVTAIEAPRLACLESLDDVGAFAGFTVTSVASEAELGGTEKSHTTPVARTSDGKTGGEYDRAFGRATRVDLAVLGDDEAAGFAWLWDPKNLGARFDRRRACDDVGRRRDQVGAIRREQGVFSDLFGERYFAATAIRCAEIVAATGAARAATDTARAARAAARAAATAIITASRAERHHRADKY